LVAAKVMAAGVPHSYMVSSHWAKLPTEEENINSKPRSEE
jgi:hypothetical protein